MRNWPSIIPDPSEDYYVVLNSYGRFGVAFAETDINRADYETTVDDLLSGQHCDPLRVIRFNQPQDRSFRRRLARHRPGNTSSPRAGGPQRAGGAGRLH